MNVLLTGATGFIGRRLLTALTARGHWVTCVVRDPRRVELDCSEVIAGDFAVDFQPAAWLDRLRDIDVVVNTVGIIRETPSQRFDALHYRAPTALFSAATTVGVRRVVQLSALGADANAVSRYHLTKRAADEFLSGLPIDWVIAQPSLVIGPSGQSTRLFAKLASVPVIPIPADGAYLVQPIDIDDLVEALVALIEAPEPQQRRVSLVGPEALRFDEFLHRFRTALGLDPTRSLRVPRMLMMQLARVSSFLPGSSLDEETLGMLLRGNRDDEGPTRQLLGRPPRPALESISRQGATLRLQAQMGWLLPLLRSSIAAVWIVTGALSLGLYPLASSYALLERVGLHGAWATAALYVGALLDIGLGVATLTLQVRKSLWKLQMAVILGYTLIISWWLPEFWLHPFGPLLKNLPLLAAIFVLYELERHPWNT